MLLANLKLHHKSLIHPSFKSTLCWLFCVFLTHTLRHTFATHHLETNSGDLVGLSTSDV
jgi:integrase